MVKQNTETDAEGKKKEAAAKQTIVAEKKHSPSKSEEKATESPNAIDFKELARSFFDGYGTAGTDELKKQANDLLKRYLRQLASQSVVFDRYNLLIIHDGSTMVKDDADNIYNAITAFIEKKPVLLILYSNGGDAGSAYLIGQLCREYAKDEFVVTVPRKAKSAATLLCCAADSIHMGSLSELGPIDPQLNQMPALGLKNSIEHIADLVSRNPGSADMFAKYLSLSLRPIDLGYYERVAESAVQYAERLLAAHSDSLSRSPGDIAQELVYAYKDHSFVIDKAEAARVFGDKIVRTGTDEYKLGNVFYTSLSWVEGLAGFLGFNFYFIGSLESEPTFMKRERNR